MRGTMLPGTVLPGTMLPGTMLPGTMLPGTVLPGTMLPGTVLPGTVLPGTVLLAALGILAGGCLMIQDEERTFVSNREILDRIELDAGYVVAPDIFELTAAELTVDALTLQYRGRAHLGDSAWVVRFAPKSTEQNPEALADVFLLLPIIQEGRGGFRVVGDDARELAGLRVRHIRYSFESRVRDADGKPLPGLGIVATVSGSVQGGPVVFHIKLDNHGDRPGLDWEDLRPFLEPLLGTVEI